MSVLLAMGAFLIIARSDWVSSGSFTGAANHQVTFSAGGGDSRGVFIVFDKYSLPNMWQLNFTNANKHHDDDDDDHDNHGNNNNHPDMYHDNDHNGKHCDGHGDDDNCAISFSGTGTTVATSLAPTVAHDHRTVFYFNYKSIVGSFQPKSSLTWFSMIWYTDSCSKFPQSNPCSNHGCNWCSQNPMSSTWQGFCWSKQACPAGATGCAFADANGCPLMQGNATNPGGPYAPVQDQPATQSSGNWFLTQWHGLAMWLWIAIAAATMILLTILVCCMCKKKQEADKKWYQKIGSK